MDTDDDKRFAFSLNVVAVCFALFFLLVAFRLLLAAVGVWPSN